MSAVVVSEITIISVLLLGLIIVLVIHHERHGDFTENAGG